MLTSQKNIKWLLVAAFAFACTAMPTYSNAAPTGDKKGRVLVCALMVKLTAFIKWPDGAGGGSDFAIGVIDDKSVAQVLGAVTVGKSVGGKSIVVKVINGADAAAAAGCNIVLIPDSASGAAAGLASGLSGKPVLLVGDSDGFAKNVGMMGFAIVGGKPKIEIHRSRLEGAGLKASAKILKLAKLVG